MRKTRLVQKLIVMVGIVSSLAVFAAEGVVYSREGRNPLKSYDLEIKDGRLLSLDGGKGLEANLGNVVDSLRDRYTGSNIVLAPGLAVIEISDLKLRASRLAEELEAIRVASGMRFDWTGPGRAPKRSDGQLSKGQGPEDFVDPITGVSQSDPVSTSSDGLYIIREAEATPDSALIVDAFNIGAYLRWLRAKQNPDKATRDHEKEVEESLSKLEGIVAEALVSLSDGRTVAAPRFQFHLGTNLLIVTGSRETVEVVRRIVDALPTDSTPSETRGVWTEGMNREMLKRYGLLPPTNSPAR